MAASSAINSSPIEDTARTPSVLLRMNQKSDRIFSYFEQRFGGVVADDRCTGSALKNQIINVNTTCHLVAQRV